MEVFNLNENLETTQKDTSVESESFFVLRQILQVIDTLTQSPKIMVKMPLGRYI